MLMVTIRCLRKEQNERFAKAITNVGNLRIFTKAFSNKNHESLINKIQDHGDLIGTFV